MEKRLMRLPEILSITGMAKQTIYRHMKNGKFPKPVKIGKRLVAWRSGDIEEWLDSL